MWFQDGEVVWKGNALDLFSQLAHEAPAAEEFGDGEEKFVVASVKRKKDGVALGVE